MYTLPCSYGATALTWAVDGNQADVVAYLRSLGAPPRARVTCDVWHAMALVLFLNKCSTDLNLSLSLPLPQFGADDKLMITCTCSPVDTAKTKHILCAQERAQHKPAMHYKLKQTGLQNAIISLLTRPHT